MYSNYGLSNYGGLLFGGSESRSVAQGAVDSAFKKFYSGITLHGDQRETCNGRRDNIVKLLGRNFEILDSFATGSIPKYTALRRPYSDVDVMVVLHFGKHIKDRKPSQVLQSIRDVIGAEYTNVRKNGQAVTVFYKTWPNVDIVPVAVYEKLDGSVDYYSVPNSNNETWIKSRPHKHANAMKARNSSFGAEFRRITKMIKWWNLMHSECLQSYHIEVLALLALNDSFSDYPWNLYQFFKQACELVRSPLFYEDCWVDDYLDFSKRQEALKRLETARDKSQAAWYLTFRDNPDSAEAKRIWTQVFGSEFPSNG